MPLDIKEHNQDKISVRNTANNLDKQLADMPDPLPNYSGFNMIIAGSSGSGKTTLLYSLMLTQESQRNPSEL
jgi:Flp pilus assembly CpaF family ATPase